MEHEREAFFDTRVGGDAEVWKALRLVCELLRKGDVVEAQGILDAVGVTCPTGRVTCARDRDRVKGGVYDERGMLYELPAYLLADPRDLVEDAEKDLSLGGDGTMDETASLGASPSTPSRRDEKGKGRMEDIGDIVRISCRLSDRGTDIVVEVGTKQQVVVMIRKLQERIGNKRIRIMYLGKAWNERRTVEDMGWKEGHVVNAMVFEGDEADIKRGIVRD